MLIHMRRTALADCELDGPFLKAYIERGVALMERLQESGLNVTITVRGFDKETHGSVFPHIFSTGYRELWGTGMSFVEAVAQTPETLKSRPTPVSSA